MATGTVKWFNAERATGSSRRTTAARTCSCTSARLPGSGYKSLAEGAKVEYEAQQGAKGPEAANVSIVA